MRPAARMLQAVARASDPACTSITATIIPLLMEQYTLQRQVGGECSYVLVCVEACNAVVSPGIAMQPLVMVHNVSSLDWPSENHPGGAPGVRQSAQNIYL